MGGVPARKGLSSSLWMQLLFELARPRLVARHLFKVYIMVDKSAIMKLCGEHVAFTSVFKGDSLLLAGERARWAYYAVGAGLKCVQGLRNCSRRKASAQPAGALLLQQLKGR